MKEAKNKNMIISAAEKLTFLKIETFIRGLSPPLFSRCRCQKMNAARIRTETTIRTGTQGVSQPTTLPSVRANRRIKIPMVTSVPPIQSTWCRRLMGSVGRGEGGTRKNAATAMSADRIANTQNTHCQSRYSVKTPP